LRAILSVPSALVHVTPAGSSTNAAAQLGDAPQRVRVGERALELRVDDRVGVAGLVAPGVAPGRWRSWSVQPAP
jgi:hypothetical protein